MDVFPKFRRVIQEGRKRAPNIRGGQNGRVWSPRKVFQMDSKSSAHSEEVRDAQAEDTRPRMARNVRGAAVTEEARLLNSMTARTEREAGRDLSSTAEGEKCNRGGLESRRGKRRTWPMGLWVRDKVRTREEGAYRQGDAGLRGTDS